jgi:hypothetical protein
MEFSRSHLAGDHCRVQIMWLSAADFREADYGGSEPPWAPHSGSGEEVFKEREFLSFFLFFFFFFGALPFYGGSLHCVAKITYG